MKTAVLIDSGSNYFGEQIQVEGIYCVCLQVVTKEKGYRDGLEITSQQAYHLLEKGEELKTSGPIVQDVIDVVEQIKKDGYEAVYCINITAGLSSTISTVKYVVEEAGLVYYGIDCYATARIELECALKARKLLDQQTPIETIHQELEYMIDHSITFVVPVDMKHLQRGGRLTPMAAKLAGLLRINPILYLNRKTSGKIESFKMVRTMKKAISYIADFFVEQKIDSSYKICIAHVLAPEVGQKMLEALTERIPNLDIYLVDLVSVVGAHTGLGCLALQYVKK